MTKSSSNRQRTRKALLLIALLTFPITMYYFSPYIIIDGALDGVINGSFIVFSIQFLSSLLLGRAFCGWVCPVGALGEACFSINDKPVNNKKLDWIKWTIWSPWMIGIVAATVGAGGFKGVDALRKIEAGFTLTDINSYINYFTVLGIFTALSLWVGKRAG